MATTALFMQLGATVLVGLLARKALSTRPGGAALAAATRKQLNRFTLWVTMPALVFQTVHGAPLGLDIIQVPAVAAAGMAGTAIIAWLFLARRYGRTPETGALVLAASAGSVSFFGIPLIRSLFSPQETLVAVYFAVLNVPLALLAGAVISSRIGRPAPRRPVADPCADPGRLSRRLGRTALARLERPRLFGSTARDSIRQFFALPATWALVAGVVLHPVKVPPELVVVLRALSASIAPTTLFALGLGLRFDRSLAPYRMAFPAAVIKLAVSPLVVFACAWVAGLSGSPLAIVSLQGAMPTQVLSVVVAERYRLDTRLVGLTLAIDTALAFVFLPVMLRAVSAAVAVAV